MANTVSPAAHCSRLTIAILRYTPIEKGQRRVRLTVSASSAKHRTGVERAQYGRCVGTCMKYSLDRTFCRILGLGIVRHPCFWYGNFAEGHGQI